YAGEKLAGAFYGSYGCTDFFDGSTAGGVMRILNDENMDFLAAPGAYSNRNPGGFTGQREMLDSFRLHGKLFFAEEDTRTHLDTPYYRDLFDCYTVNDSINVLKRDFGRIIAAGEYAWWFDQLIGGGRYECEEMYALFARQQKIAGEIYSETQVKRNEIAFIYDEESIHAVSDITTKETVEYFRNYEIAKIGAGADEYFHNDMSLDEMPDYKLYVFFNTFVLSDEERAAIRKKLAKNGAVAVWVYASGLINPDRAEKLNVNYVSELTGMTMKRLDERWSSRFKWDKGLEIFEGLNKDAFYGDKDRPTRNNILVSQREIKTYLCPVIYPCDNSAEVLARYSGNGLPAVAMKRAEGYTSVYYGAKTMRSDFVRAAARFAGVHIYCDSDDVFYYGNGLLTIHASATGKKTIRLPKRCAVRNAYDGTDPGITDTIELSMKLGETASFYVKEREA
ncbi:MAG: hypothetical protein ACI4RO_04760, partial [Candidatus Scatosoma sp.]